MLQFFDEFIIIECKQPHFLRAENAKKMHHKWWSVKLQAKIYLFTRSDTLHTIQFQCLFAQHIHWNVNEDDDLICDLHTVLLAWHENVQDIN